MKNIHVLPTEKPSRLYLTTKEYIFEEEYSLSTDECQNKHIYITSDEPAYPYAFHITNQEVLKVRAVGYKSLELYHDKGFSFSEQCRKIILTTDQDLIKDGVQAIDNKFLEWFVKNPSCEEVEINYEIYKKGIGLITSDWRMSKDDKYRIIIPKEETKQETLGEMPEKQENCCTPVGHIRRYKDCIGCDRKSKQETLEEASREYYKRGQLGFEKAADTEMAFLRGAKWQQERMYSIIDEYVNDVMGGCNLRFEEWFEQFKNK